MDFTVNQSYAGFKLIQKETIEELNSLAMVFEHEKNGAEVLVMENDDDNKVFSATFRTPPKNDHGVAHIMEHSVLCGSKKYPVKEPFMEMVKGSLQTFLNAMTYPDKTMYPVASRNAKDFRNLMSVYLDAVFYPHITEEIFMQEGWHHEMEADDQAIVYKGVVYNEMKGVFSSPESILDRYLDHSLFPDSPYGFESGGDPKSIPDLTYQEFKEFHEKYYHPSNCRLFFYGDGDTLEYLQFVNDKYLQDFERAQVDSSIPLQKTFSSPKREVIHYPVSEGESLDKKTFVSMGMKLGLSTDHEHCMGMSILSYLLLGTSASPLRKALMDSNLGSEIIGGGFDDHRAETVFAVGLKGSEEENEEQILDLIFSTLKGLVENGIEEDMIQSAVNSIDFKLREANFGGFAKGIVYNIQALGSWLYDEDPLIHLRYDEQMQKIKTESKNRYFEKLIEQNLLNNKHQSVLIAKPQPGLAGEAESEMKDKLGQLKNSLNDDEKQDLVKKTKALQELQMTPDSPEALATLPMLDLSDINRSSESFPLEIKKESSPCILYHDLFTNNIAYTQIGFNTQGLAMDQIQYLPLLGRLVMGMGTNKRSYVEMSQRIGIHTGGIRPWHFSSSPIDNREEIISYLFFSGKGLMEKLDDLFDIFKELFAELNFSNHKRLVEIIRSSKADMEDSIVPHGNQYVLSRLKSYHSKLGQFDEYIDGITYYRFLQDLLKRVEKDPGEVAEKFMTTAKTIFSRQNVLINLTGEEKHYALFEKQIDALMDIFPDTPSTPQDLQFSSEFENEGFLTASTVQYVGKGANLYDMGFQHSGQFDVLKSLLGTSFLWDRVRVRGGAYGSSSTFDLYSGDFNFVSYRDPNLGETLDVYDEATDYLKQLDLSEAELNKLIIGCVGHLDPPFTSDRKGTISMIEHLTGRNHSMKQKHRDEMLSTQVEDLKAFAPLFQEIKEKGKVCVLGNEEKIRDNEPVFKELVKVFE
jgi:hypothetical protein